MNVVRLPKFPDNVNHVFKGGFVEKIAYFP